MLKMNRKGFKYLSPDKNPDMVIVAWVTYVDEHSDLTITIGRFYCDCPRGVSGIFWRGIGRVVIPADLALDLSAPILVSEILDRSSSAL